MKCVTLLFAFAFLTACGTAQTPSDSGPPPDVGPWAEHDANFGTCSSPPTVSYTCDPLPPGSVGCSGPSTTYPQAVPDPNAVYPVGCAILYPFCHRYYPNSVASCNCYGDPPQWTCGL